MSAPAPLAEAEAAAAAGDAERVRSLFVLADGAVLPDAERFRWCLLLIEAGAFEEAQASIDRLGDATARATVASLLAASDAPPGAADEADDVDLRPADAAHAGEDLVASFLRWFGGRRDLYAAQWSTSRSRRRWCGGISRDG